MSIVTTTAKILSAISESPDAGVNRTPWLALEETSIIYNTMYRVVCEELVAIKNGEARHLYIAPDDRKQLQAMVEVILTLNNKAGNFALTRLVGKPEWKALEGTLREVEKAKEGIEKSIERTKVSIEKLDPQKNGTSKKKAELEEHIRIQSKKKELFNLALMGFKRVSDEGWAPLKDLYTRELNHSSINGSWRISDLEKLESTRPIFNEAIQALKSLYELLDDYAEAHAAWSLEREEFRVSPDYANYQAVAKFLSKEDLPAPLNKLSPADWIKLLTQAGEALVSWREQTALQLPETLSQSAEEITKISSPKNRKGQYWRRELFRLNPELKALYDMHQHAIGIFSREPKEPKLTLPDPLEHPRAIIWEKSQWKEIRLAADTLSGRHGSMELRLPLLCVREGRLITSPQWVSVSGDKRLIDGSRKDVDGNFLYLDSITNAWVPFEFGAIRLNIIRRGRRSDYRLSFTQKTEDESLPDWVAHYKKNRCDSYLPKNLIVLCFVHDTSAQGVIKFAFVRGTEDYVYLKDEDQFIPAPTPVNAGERGDKTLPAIEDSELFSGGERRLSYPKPSEISSLNLGGVSVLGSGLVLRAKTSEAQDIDRHRWRAEGLKMLESEYQHKLQNAKDSRKRLLLQCNLSQKELRALSDRKKKIEKALHGSETSDERKEELKHELERLPLSDIREFDKLMQAIKTNTRNLTTRRPNNWARVRTLGNDRVNVISGQVMRVIEELRKSYPDYEVTLLLPEEVAHKPQKGQSSVSNRAKMATHEGGLYLKLEQMAEARPTPVPVFHIYDFGLSDVNPTPGLGIPIKAFWDSALRSYRIPQGTEEETQSAVFLVVEKEGGAYSIREEALASPGLKASNAIRIFIDPNHTPSRAKIKSYSERAALLMGNEKFVSELNRRFAK